MNFRLKLTTVLSIILLALLSINASAQLVRKYSNEFLSIGVGARALGMSNAQVALVDDVTGGYWNPAGIAGCGGGLQMAAMHSAYFGNIANYDYGSVAIPITGKTKNNYLALSLIRFAIDDIPNTLHLVDANSNVDYTKITSFSAADYSFIGSYAQDIMSDRRSGNFLRVGGSSKIIYRRVGDFAHAWGFGFDAGAQYHYNGLLLGAMIRDVTSTFNAWSFSFSPEDQLILTQTNNEIPVSSTEITLPRIIMGGGYNFKVGEKFNVIPAFDLDITTDGKRNVLVSAKPFSLDPHMGVEASYNQMIFLRGGVGRIQRATDDTGKKITTLQPNMGIGFKFKQFSIDYALTNIGQVSEVLYSHVFSLKLNFNKRN